MRQIVRRLAASIIVLSAACTVTLAAGPASAADADVTIAPRPAAPAAVDRYAPLRNKRVEYGCKRIWRCDEQVCEWRRGCWGIYGYMESPYYSVPLARSHWNMHGWPSAAGN